MARAIVDQPDAVESLSILDPQGRIDPAHAPLLSVAEIRRLYETMVLARRLDDRIVTLQRQGRIATALSNRGQEAVAMGAAAAIEPRDWMVPYFRELAAYLHRGWRPDRLLLFLAGYAEGLQFPPEQRDLPLCIPVASQLPHAVGLAYAGQYKGEDSVVLVFLGDGATSHGDFHEAMNFAGVFQAPVVFCCANNGWAISVPIARQTRARTLARKAGAYGVTGIQVDGNDLLAVHAATHEAVQRARRGGGPTFIECMTYRMGAHSTADDPRRYRTDEATREWERRDPLLRLRRYLEPHGLDDAAQAQLEARADEEIKAAVARATEAQGGIDLLQVIPQAYGDDSALSPEVREQRDAVARHLATLTGAGA
jgi:pyruvate dehydrogenase E1 component alpha subunit